MLGLQRSTETFRRSGSSGLVWEDRHLPAEMNASSKPGGWKGEDSNVVLRQSQSAGTIGMMRRSRSGSGGGGGGRLGGGGGAKSYRTDQVEPAMDPPSPKVSCCGFFGELGGTGSSKRSKARRR
ncbi:hypothetical protein HPP92_021545 [Vanilla planifolia]|uniref:Uncharacterized protein n=1 Tax=Vanilla planifolia TaxID=51239 RepID=A0A835PYC6_VANPL|nr:hypothetical protein HPP92_021545 [Vanilla planifolia]